MHWSVNLALALRCLEWTYFVHCVLLRRQKQHNGMKCQQQALWKLWKSPTDTHAMLRTAYGDEGLSRAQHSDGLSISKIILRSGRPKTTSNLNLVDKVSKFIHKIPPIDTQDDGKWTKCE